MSFTNGVHFIEIPHRVQPKILVLISNFFSLNFTSIETEGERGSSSQNERTFGEGGAGGAGGVSTRTRKKKVGGGGQNSGILSERITD